MNVNRFFNPNYFPMKRSVMNAGLFALVFVFGGMFLAVESQAQTTTAQYHATAPSGSAWVTTPQANLTVSQQISLLTNNVNNLVQAGADNQSILLAKRELLLWVYIQEYLASRHAGRHRPGKGPPEDLRWSWRAHQQRSDQAG
jgi:hypothetical protein